MGSSFLAHFFMRGVTGMLNVWRWVLICALVLPLMTACSGPSLRVKHGDETLARPGKIAVIALNNPQVADLISEHISPLLEKQGIRVLHRRQTEILGGKTICPGQQLRSKGALNLLLASGVDALMFVKVTEEMELLSPGAIQAEIVAMPHGEPLVSIVWSNSRPLLQEIKPKHEVSVGTACQIVAERIAEALGDFTVIEAARFSSAIAAKLTVSEEQTD